MPHVQIALAGCELAQRANRDGILQIRQFLLAQQKKLAQSAKEAMSHNL